MAINPVKSAFLALALAGVFSPGIAAGQTAPARPTMVLADGWRFKLDASIVGAERPDFDDGGWATVSVPHSWNRVGYYRSDPQAHLNKPELINKTLGVGWYRLHFNAAASFKGKRAWLQFDAASRIAEIWLNGIKLGEHKGGFSRFRFDATAALRLEGQNVLVVKVDNAKPEAGSSTVDVLPLTGDFFVYGGLYRPVSLIATDQVHIDMLDHGGPGVYATTTSIDGRRAAVRIRAGLRNDGPTSSAGRVVARLEDSRGRTAAQVAQALTLPTGGEGQFDRTLHLPVAHLWNGVADPYLYRLVVEVRAANGQVLDKYTQPFGVRTMRFDSARGFFLNGKPYRLQGVGYHQGREGVGWATSAADTEEDLATLREMGANTIRLTHYQHGQPVHDLADRYGFVLWDEIPLVSQWTMGDARTASAGLIDNARQQMAEEIRQNGNHASVATWGIANEVDFGNSLPGFLSNGTGTPPDPGPLLRNLNGFAHELDPSRPTSIATCCEGRLFATGVDVPITATETDLAGANRYFGWYYGKVEDLGPSLDALHAKRPGQALAVTEYGAGGALNIHTDNPDATPADSRGRMQPEEVESMIHERSWAALRIRPYLWATWLWSAFDFASTIRHEGDAEDINTKGLVSYDHKTRKDAFYFYKANWTTSPTLHINGRRYVDRAYAVTDVRIYSNAQATTLTVNGRTIGTLTACPERVCVWKSVRLKVGDNDIQAEGRFAGRKVVDRVHWRLSGDASRNVRIDTGALVAAASHAGQFGSDDFFDGGEAGSVDKPANYGKAPTLAVIAATDERDIAATYRHGRFAYHVPVQNGRYSVKLTFVEPSAASGERVFDVLVNGVPTLKDVDVASEAGGPLAALQRTFEVAVRNGMIDLGFVPTKGEAIISSIEILRVANKH
ncbi:MAG: glycoside hydrolase family 2 TIM barrel-domain containing protein [Sphingomonas sp.]